MSAPASSCGAQLTFDELLRAATGTDASGNPILRLTNVAVDSGNYYTCNNQGTEFNPATLFGLNEEGKIALRVNISNLT